MGCKVQRKHCRQNNKERQKKKVDVVKINNPTSVNDESEMDDAPKSRATW